ncbi:nucleoprotein/polynucleotide-associated enzyme [Stenotrophomonas daejeonensis]|uniref:Nucleoprotein/polynucleotide-associated enzyme n=1 Tax=Stenotrophomonas daejeonensis TaxID=659018 RepID=A0A0R0E0S2_9GAMM|nr:DUF2058 domain-containing protein [Stenotrophomonas daejeonensis]KRG87445.1 nucleoprotein/polynucleotide-associated enzyme [Stenotrophomonas daejeonensis]
MAKANPLQEQLLKAGLVKKSQVAQVAREQNKARHAKGAPAGPSESQLEAERARAEKAERDRVLAAEHNARRRADELRAQARQIIADRRVPRSGELEYRFDDGAVIRTLLVDEAQRKQLAAGTLVIARHGEGFELLPRVAAEKVRERDATLIVLDHGQGGDVAASTGNAEDDAYYAQFVVPDDLMW